MAFGNQLNMDNLYNDNICMKDMDTGRCPYL